MSLEDSRGEASDFSKNFVGGLGPDKRFRIRVRLFDVNFDRSFELIHARVGAPFDLTFREQGEPTFDEIEPRTVRRDKMEMETRMPDQPAVDHRALVGSVIIQNHMDFLRLRRAFFDVREELPKLYRSVPRVTFPDHFSGLHVESCK